MNKLERKTASPRKHPGREVVAGAAIQFLGTAASSTHTHGGDDVRAMPESLSRCDFISAAI
jgi:hypothetical protein